MAFITTEPAPLTRVHIDKLSEATDTAPPITSTMVDSLDGNNRIYIEEKMAERYAQYITKGKDEVTGIETQWIAKDNAAKNAAIQYGLFEICGLFTYNNIIREKATLFTLGADYEYDGSNAETFAEDIEAAREMANRDLAMGRVDELSVAVGSSCVLVQVLGSKLDYQAIPRDKIWVAFADQITEGDKLRPTNTMNIEEATAIVIQLSAPEMDGTSSFVAYYGRSDKYPNGRQVKYTAQQWDDIPDVDESENVEFEDYMAGEEIANPMTYFQTTESGDAVTPEYPVAIWSGSTTGYGSDLLPITDGLYHQTLELDLGSSRVLMSAVKSARGVFAVSRDEASSNVIPDAADEGVVMFEMGQQLSTHSIPGTNIKEAMAVLEKMAAFTSVAFGVPSYRLGLSAAAVESAAALRELNKPLIRDRQSRVALNRSNVSRIFDIERILASMENGEATGKDITETWIPHDMKFEKTDLEVLNEKKLQLEMEVTHLEKVAEEVLPHVNSPEEAETWLEEVREKKAAQPVAQATPTRAIDRLRAGRQQAAQ
jgi:hypothetical protein